MAILLVVLLLAASATAAPSSVLRLGANVLPGVAVHLQSHFQSVDPHAIVGGDPDLCISAALCVILGNDTLRSNYISEDEMGRLQPEGFIVRSNRTASGVVVAGDGKPAIVLPRDDPGLGHSLGAGYAGYASLERLGFGFIHPLEPSVPASFETTAAAGADDLIHEAPLLTARVDHYHTQHPLDLQDVLNGFNASTSDLFGRPLLPGAYFEAWESMLPGVRSYAEWLVANRQNRIEWLVLWTEEWQAYGNSTERQQRMSTLVDLFHSFGILAGVDAPIALRQQHAWYFTNGFGSLEQQFHDIHTHVDWFATAGFDFLATEAGTTEFTHPNCTKSLAWMNETALYAWNEHRMRSYIKAHCSAGQVCEGYANPYGPGDINFNFLPSLANPLMGVMPHTVEVYSYDDPAPTYGNANLTYIFEYMFDEAEANKHRAQPRDVVFYPESTYWVNYDIDVPLLLGPLYGQRRLAGMRHIAQTMQERGISVDGQNVFDSGWEFGYSVGAVVAARAAYNPGDLSQSLDQAYETALHPITSVMGQEAGSQLGPMLVNMTVRQRQLLVWGLDPVQPAGTTMPNVTQLNGMAYLNGLDSWADISALLGSGTQPIRAPLWAVALQPAGAADSGADWTLSRLCSSATRDGHLQAEVCGHLTGLRSVLGPAAPVGMLPVPSYQSRIRPLLQQVVKMTSEHLQQLASLAPLVAPAGQSLFGDILTAANLTSMRAAQVFHTYEAMWQGHTFQERQAALSQARALTVSAASLMHAARTDRFRVNWHRIASWRKSATSYPFSYLWTAATGYYLWRDVDQATAILNATAAGGGNVDRTKLSPCYLNIQDPADVAIALPWLNELARVVREAGVVKYPEYQFLTDCTAAPLHGYTFPSS